MPPRLVAFPLFETGRLTIKPLSDDDAEAVTTLTDNPAITDSVHFLPSPFTRSDAHALIANNDDENCFLGVFRAGELIGIFGTHAHGDDRLEIGYWIGLPFQRQG